MKNRPLFLCVCGFVVGLLQLVSVGAADLGDLQPPASETLEGLAQPATNAPAQPPEPQISAAEMREFFRAYVQLQQQLHDALLAIEQNRREAAETANRGTESVTASLRQLERSFEGQRERDMEVLRASNRSVVALAGVFAGSALLALVAAAWLQFRAINRLAQAAPALHAGRMLPYTAAAGALELGAETDEASARLREAVQTLEHRIRELEHSAGNHPNGESARHMTDRVTVLLGKGQTLLHLNDPEGALNCFEEAMGEDPANPEIFIKKGTALEKLRRLTEAIECYDRAIELNDESTLAYLYKGGVFNQLERFNEALECYEQALRSQQKSVANVQ